MRNIFPSRHCCPGHIRCSRDIGAGLLFKSFRLDVFERAESHVSCVIDEDVDVAVNGYRVLDGGEEC